MEKTETCGTCKHYIGGGDWNLCCDLKHEGYPCGFLCYSYTEACEKYEFSQGTVDREKEKREELRRYAKEIREKKIRERRGEERND